MDEGIKVALFDLGNVLIDFDYTISAQKISHFCSKCPEDIIKFFFGSAITTSFEEGKISPKDFFSNVKEMLGLRLSYEAFVPIWNEVFFLSAKNRSVFNLINNLKQYYKVALLSNTNTLHYEYLKKHFPVFNIFDKVFVSCELGLVKPDPLIYQKTLKALEVPAECVFYTDDRQELIKSARGLGLKAFVFNGVRQLKADFLSAGLLLTQPVN